MVITKEFLSEIITPNGGYTKDQLQILGISWPPKSGWKKKVIGKKISNEDYLKLSKKTNLHFKF